MLPQPTPQEPEVVAQTQDALLARILDGTYPPGGRLPAERDLAAHLACSRPSLREALSRLAEWDILEIKRGSGATVQPLKRWSLGVLPAWLKHRGGDPSWLPDLLALRRALITELIRRIAPRLPPNTPLLAPRAAVERAFNLRHQPADFVRADLDVLRELALAAHLLPGLWALNTVSAAYLDLAAWITADPELLDAYRDAYLRLLQHLEAGRGDDAALTLDAWLQRHDHALLHAFTPQDTP